MSFLLALSAGWWASVGHDSVDVPVALPRSLHRWQRRHLTYVLNLAWSLASEVPLWSPLAGFGPAARPSLKRRRHRQLFRRKVVCWTRSGTRGPRWSGRPDCGVRLARQTTLDRWLLAHPSEGNVLRLLNAAWPGRGCWSSRVLPCAFVPLL